MFKLKKPEDEYMDMFAMEIKRNSELRRIWNMARSDNLISDGIQSLYGTYAALSFGMGLELVCENLKSDILEFKHNPSLSYENEDFMASSTYLPKMFRLHYDEDLLRKLYERSRSMLQKIKSGDFEFVSCAADELLIRAAEDDFSYLMNIVCADESLRDKDWVFEMIGDRTLEKLFESETVSLIPKETSPYHVNNWFKELADE